jgi:L-ascorbate metabolism protein UlaG (beta-lactamase superfamily)
MIRTAAALIFLLCGATTTPAQLSNLSDSQEPNGIRLTYLGHAGWEISDGRTVVLVDPFVSRFALDESGAEPSPDGIVAPDTAAIDARIRRADYILITHGHWDHMLDAPYIARRSGAVIIGHETAANIARAYGLTEANIITVRGGEDFEFGRFTLRVIPNLHSALYEKRYYSRTGYPGSGNAPAGLRPPLRRSDFVEGGNLAYLLRIGGYQVLIMGSMNYVEREMQGLRPDVALVGANRSRHEIYDYTGRLMRALGEPSVVIPNHADAPGDQPFLGPMARNVEAFEKEVKAASPTSRVLIPSWFEPITLPERRHHSAKDLLIAERAVELLSTLTWDPREAGSACAVDTNTITLRCAVIRATQEIDGESMVLLHAFTWEVLYQVAVRLGADTPQTDLVATYENRPGATAAEMLSLVRQVRDHIRANLQLEQ